MSEAEYYAAIEAKRARGDTHDWPESFLGSSVRLYRGDCMSVLGIAAQLMRTMKRPRRELCS